MAIPEELIEDARFVKKTIEDSQLSAELKRMYVKLINMTTEATNGFSPDEKIQRMTESMFFLASLHVQHTIEMDERINTAITCANKKQCDDCKAMKFVNIAEEKARQQKIIDEYRQQQLQTKSNLVATVRDLSKMSWQEVAKAVVVKPYIYILLTTAVISPFGLPIIERILDFFLKK